MMTQHQVSLTDSESNSEDEDDNLTKQTRGERLLKVAEEAIKAEESENNARTRVEAPRPLSSAPRTTREGPTTTRQRPPAAQRTHLGHDRGDEAWLNLEQVASIIQLHNKGQTGRNIVTTLLQGTERKDWDTLWKHMRAAEEAAAEMTGNTGKGSADDVRPTPLPPQKKRNLGDISHEHARSLEAES